MTTAERFWAKVRKTEGCWLWTASTTGFGYGKFWLPQEQKIVNAHRAAWILTYGPLLESVQVLHKCDNPPCTRLDHLFLGTQHDNMLDARAKGRFPWTKRTHCPRGHLLVGDNIRRFKRQTYPGLIFTACRICSRAARMRHYYEHRAREA